MSPVCGRHAHCASAIFSLLFICYETMSNCSQNCCIDWNSAMLCFAWLFYIEVWTSARFVHHILCTCEIWSDEVKLAVAPCGSSEKNCWSLRCLNLFNSSFQNYHMVLPQASPHHLKTPWKATEIDIWSDSNKCTSHISLVDQKIKFTNKNVTLRWFWSRPMTRNRRLLLAWSLVSCRLISNES